LDFIVTIFGEGWAWIDRRTGKTLGARQPPSVFQNSSPAWGLPAWALQSIGTEQHCVPHPSLGAVVVPELLCLKILVLGTWVAESVKRLSHPGAPGQSVF